MEYVMVEYAVKEEERENAREGIMDFVEAVNKNGRGTPGRDSFGNERLTGQPTCVLP